MPREQLDPRLRYRLGILQDRLSILMIFSRRTSKSRIVAGIIWIFVAAYVFDATNLEDLIPGTFVMHPDSDESVRTPDASPSDTLLTVPATLTSPYATAAQSSKRPTLRIIIDQDSFSLGAEQLVATTCSTVLSEEHRLPLRSYRSAPSLYLLNCTLVI